MPWKEWETLVNKKVIGNWYSAIYWTSTPNETNEEEVYWSNLQHGRTYLKKWKKGKAHFCSVRDI
jgi:hypothetical protein